MSLSHTSGFSIEDYQSRLIAWENSLDRPMPWKGEKDPYKIWISEIILQQTRVEQGWPYYTRFIEALPDVSALASAPEQQIMNLWQGLGYYRRALHLIETARLISQKYGGVFPDKYEDILQLKGIGPYTAAAISSFAYGLPYAVLDGNVMRILARLFRIEQPIDQPNTQKQLKTLAQQLIPHSDPGIYNQAVMDLGATICIPQKPLCGICPISGSCSSYQTPLVDILPIKSKIVAKKTRYFNYLILENENNEIYIEKRSGNDIWKNLYQFFLFESDKPTAEKEVDMFIENNKNIIKNYTMVSASEVSRHVLTHRYIELVFFHFRVSNNTDIRETGLWTPYTELKNYPFPQPILQYIQNYFINLPN